jgi:K319L-like, PKD domain
MSSIIKAILGLFLVLFITGCMKVIEIEGNKEISINESHTYKAVIVSTKFSDMDSYKWKVISDNKDYTLTGETTSEITFSASSVGTYTLKVIAKKNKKPFKATIEVVVTEPEIINGYILPPEPDETLNNSTLLGVDSNDNGVRDDVERKIIITYQEPIKIELMMSRAKVSQEILANPVGLATEHKNKMTKILDCELYLMDFNVEIENSVESINNFAYTTKQRVRAYLDYNLALSGGVYGSSPANQNAQACDFDVEHILKDIK